MSEQEPTIEEIEPFPLDPLPMEKRDQEPKIESNENQNLKEGRTLSIEYLTGLWNLSRERVLEKILKEKIPYDVVDGQIRVSSDAVPVGGK